MTMHSHLDPSAFYFKGNETGVLLLHGFTGSPTEMRYMGDYLAQEGYTVSCPLLPGHGTSVDDLERRKREDWIHAAREAADMLRKECNRTILVGFSLGGLLALDLAARESYDGAVLIAPGLFVINRLAPLAGIASLFKFRIPQDSAGDDLLDPAANDRVWCYDQIPARAAHQVMLLAKNARRLLPQVTLPVLTVLSKGDKSVAFHTGEYLMEHLGSTRKELMILEGSGHNILVDGERDRVNQRVLEFVADVTQ